MTDCTPPFPLPTEAMLCVYLPSCAQDPGLHIPWSQENVATSYSYSFFHSPSSSSHPLIILFLLFSLYPITVYTVHFILLPVNVYTFFSFFFFHILPPRFPNLFLQSLVPSFRTCPCFTLNSICFVTCPTHIIPDRSSFCLYPTSPSFLHRRHTQRNRSGWKLHHLNKKVFKKCTTQLLVVWGAIHLKLIMAFKCIKL